MNIRASGLRETLEEVLYQLGLKSSHGSSREFGIHYAESTPPKIDRGGSEGFVHGHQEIPGAKNATFVSQRSIHRLTEGNAHVFDGVVLVYLQIAGGLQAEIEGAVACDEIQHVIEKSNARGDFGFASTIEIQPEIDLGFLSIALYSCGPGHNCPSDSR
jgi:hypothetical protein